MIKVRNTWPVVVRDEKYAFLPYQQNVELSESEDYVLPLGVVLIKDEVGETPKTAVKKTATKTTSVTPTDERTNETEVK